MVLQATLLLLAFLPSSFENKNDALDHLNSMNIWVAATPSYYLSSSGKMSISFDDASLTYEFNLEKTTFESTTENGVTTISIKCEEGMCIGGHKGRYKLETDEAILVMKSAFARDGSTEYQDQYPEKAASIIDAFEYLQKFYK